MKRVTHLASMARYARNLGYLAIGGNLPFGNSTDDPENSIVDAKSRHGINLLLKGMALNFGAP